MKIAYFDNSATTFPKPEIVYDFMDKFYRENGVNVGRGQHKLASKASFLVDETRKLLQEILRCENKEIIFTATATEGINFLLNGIEWGDGMNVYLSPFEHNSVTRTLQHLQKKYQLNIKNLNFSKEKLEYELNEIENNFKREKPGLLIVSHCSNVFGVLAPIEELTHMSKKYGALNIIDMCQTAGLIDINVGNDNIDAVVFAGHKTLYGPFGVSGVAIKKGMNLSPFIYGGTGIDSANQDMPESSPAKYEAGSHNILSISGLNAALKWIKEIGVERIHQSEKKIFSKLIEILRKYKNIEIIGYKETAKQVGVVSCKFEGYSSDEIGQVLSDMDIAVRTGLHCSPMAHKFFGTFPAGTVRFSIGYFTSQKDLEKLEEALRYIEENS